VTSTSPRRRVALVSGADDARAALADYLTNAGFEVHPCDDLAAPGAFAALVLIARPGDSGDAITGRVRSWMKQAKHPRVVVVTSRPRALVDLVASHGHRLHVLPAPAFGWDVVDALRARSPA
jgi:hypothetical protein